MDKFHISYNGTSWYTTTPTNKQAMELAKYVMETYAIETTIERGDHINFKTGKPAYYLLTFSRKPEKQACYRIQNENGTFYGAGTDSGSWFTLEDARKIKQEGQRIVEHDGMYVLWEVL